MGWLKFKLSHYRGMAVVQFGGARPMNRPFVLLVLVLDWPTRWTFDVSLGSMGERVEGGRFMIREQFPKASARRCGTGRIRGIIPEKSLLFPSLGDTPRVVNPETEPETNSRSQPLEGAT